jgi:hypothetical protein
MHLQQHPYPKALMSNSGTAVTFRPCLSMLPAPGSALISGPGFAEAGKLFNTGGGEGAREGAVELASDGMSSMSTLIEDSLRPNRDDRRRMEKAC